ncbi:hypothetical protein D1122_14065 [Cereibacter sphaeroides]|uniref:hypothetical protein n=1 Tax=Cereibacter sphaeroides TaxID=1063 RepID=UPI000E5C3BC1|nr:hypothetical protein [Cereibacter sphaeroides]RHZ95560.1 hypothetical protein D1122_14065 [Cereibacter sphaeroides]
MNRGRDEAPKADPRRSDRSTAGRAPRNAAPGGPAATTGSGVVRGVHAPAPRPTAMGGLWLALFLTLPFAALGVLIDFGTRLLQ